MVNLDFALALKTLTHEYLLWVMLILLALFVPGRTQSVSLSLWS